MVIGIFSPQIDFMIAYFTQFLRRKYDQGWFTCKRVKTKTKSIYDYVNLYSGTEYNIALRYSFVLKYVFTSFMYGPIFPIVWPITLVALVNISVWDKIVMFYFHKAPPKYD